MDNLENLEELKEKMKIVPVPETKLEDFLAVLHFMAHLTSIASVLQLIGGEAGLAEIIKTMVAKQQEQK